MMKNYRRLFFLAKAFIGQKNKKNRKRTLIGGIKIRRVNHDDNPVERNLAITPKRTR